MDRGRIVQIGAPRELYEHPANRFVASFIGEGSLIEGTVLRDEQGEASLLPRGGSQPLPARRTDLPKGAAAFILLRPEKLRLSRPDQGGGGAQAEVLDTVYVGDITRVTLRMHDGATLVAKETNHADSLRWSPGAEVSVAWAREDAALLPAEHS
jgi:ABC-type Fe3+/spermidine/putrescine transport system ATPase subunit